MDHPDKKRCVVTVVHGGNETDVQLPVGDNLLMGLVRANMPIDFYCTTGKCATCRLRMDIPAGSAVAPSETEQYRLGQDAMAKGYRLACQVYVSGPMRVFLDAP